MTNVGGIHAAAAAVARDRSTSAAKAARPFIVLVDRETFVRECTAATLQRHETAHELAGFGRIEDWTASACADRTELLILRLPERSAFLEDFDASMRALNVLAAPPPIVILSDRDDRHSITYVMRSGASAFLPSSMPFERAVKVVDLVRAGGVYFPADLLEQSNDNRAQSAPPPDVVQSLSPRQWEIAQRICHGLSNRAVGAELGLSENTVKVHVRVIMKKLRCRNRTEVAFLIRQSQETAATD